MKKRSLSSLCLSVVLLIVGCSKEEKENTAEQNGSPYYFSATINGKTVNYEANDVNSRFECGTSSPSGSIGDEHDAYEGTFIQDSQDQERNNISVHILQHFSSGEPTYAQRLAMFRLGNYSYGKPGINGEDTRNGASVTYTDENGVLWESEAGAQTGSTFSISEISDNDNGTSDKIIKAGFSCKLYSANGSSIQLSGGTIRAKVLTP